MISNGFTLRKCLWLCLPALIVGAALRIWFMMAIPEGSYSADSSSFFEPTRRLVLGKGFDVSEKRRWLYPILLVPTGYLPAGPVKIVPVVQHLMGLITIFGVGWIVGNLTRVRALTVPAVTLLYAVWPRVLWYEHEVLAEAVFISCFIGMVAMAVPLGSLKDRRKLFWFLIAAGLVVSVRPHGRGIWLAAMISATLIAGWPIRWDWNGWKAAAADAWKALKAVVPRNRANVAVQYWKNLGTQIAQFFRTLTPLLPWGWKCMGAVAAAVVVIMTSGNTGQGNWLLLSSTLPLVDLDGKTFPEYREALKPLVLETRADGVAYAATQENYKKRLNSRHADQVSPEWAKLTRDRPLFSKVCKTFAHEGLMRHPFRFFQITTSKILLAMQADWARSTFAPATFWEKQADLDPKRWKKNSVEMAMAFGVKDRAEYDALMAKGRTKEFGAVPFLHGVAWNFAFVKAYFDETARTLSFQITWLGALAVWGLAVSLFPGRFKAMIVLWLPAILYVYTVFAIGDRLPRFVHPVEWVGWVLAAVGVDFVLVTLGKAFRRKSSSPLEAVQA